MVIRSRGYQFLFAVVGIMGVLLGGERAARGDTVVVDRVHQTEPGGSIYGADPSFPYTGEGGEFTLIPSDAALLGLYSPLALVADPNISNEVGVESFCLELSAGFPSELPTAPLDEELSPTIINDPGEQIALGTAWLYSQFAAGTLAGYDYGGAAAIDNPWGWTSARGEDAAALQAAIWFLQGQYPDTKPGDAFAYAGGTGNPYLTLLTTGTASGGMGLGSLDAAEAPDAGVYNVEAMNIGDPGVRQYQAQLVLADPPGNVQAASVPECGTPVMLVAAFLAGGVRMVRKRFRKR